MKQFFFFKGFTFDQIETEIAFKMIILNDLKRNQEVFEDYRKFVNKQLEVLKKFWERKLQAQEHHVENRKKKNYMDNKFNGLPSYDLKVFFLNLMKTLV